MSTPSSPVPAAELSTSDFLAELPFAAPTLISASNGEYLDLAPAEEGAPTRFITVPVSRLRHAFRIHRVEDKRTRRWKVDIEPVPLQGAPHSTPSAAGATPPARYELELAHHGCLNFGFSVPETKADKGTTLHASAEVFASLRQVEGLSFSAEIDLATLAFTASSINFPVFTGDSKRAFDYIASKLTDGDPHSETVDSSWLNIISRPSDIPEAAWTPVMNQLYLEVHYRRLCSEYFQSFREFTQNVFIANAGLVSTIGSLMELESDTSKILHLGVEGMFGAMASGVGALKFTGAGVVSGGLKLAFEFMLKDQGPSARDLAVTYANARDELAKKFNGIITQIQRSRIDVFKDWGKLKQMGESMTASDGKNRWPGDDSEMRTEAGRLMEVSLWKDLLKVKWHHMKPSNAPKFLTSYNDENKRNMERINKNYWVEYKPGRGAQGLTEVDGFYITNHWLGYGGTIFTHHEPSGAMCDRLFSEQLKISRKDVFTDSSWNLTPEKFLVQS